MQRNGIKLSVFLLNSIDKFLHLEKLTPNTYPNTFYPNTFCRHPLQPRQAQPLQVTCRKGLLEQTGVHMELQLVPHAVKPSLALSLP